MRLLVHRCRKFEKGFSLTEVLVALAIFTLLGIAALESIPAAKGLKKSIERQEEFLDLDFFLGEASLMGENSSYTKLKIGTLPLFYNSDSSPSLLAIFSLTPDSIEVSRPSLRNYIGFFYCRGSEESTSGNSGAIVEAPSGRVVVGGSPGETCYSLGASGFLPFVLISKSKDGLEAQAGNTVQKFTDYEVMSFDLSFRDENGNETTPPRAANISYEIILRHRRSHAQKRFEGIIPLR